MITSYEGIQTLSDELVDMWGDAPEAKTLKGPKAKDALIEKIEGPTTLPISSKIVNEDVLDTQPYYVYKHCIQVIRELVGDMGFNKTEKEIRQIARQMWPKYSNKLNIVREAKSRYEQEETETKENQREEIGETARLSRRKAKTGLWGKILDNAKVDKSKVNSGQPNINSEPYYVYKYFMSIVREQSRGMGLKHTKEEVQRMGVELWPTFQYKDFLISRALAQYRRELATQSKNQTTTKAGSVNEETQTEFQEPPPTTIKRVKSTNQPGKFSGRKKV